MKEESTKQACNPISLMQYLDANRADGKMCLSNAECAQIKKAWDEGDWETTVSYILKYMVDIPTIDELKEEMPNGELFDEFVSGERLGWLHCLEAIKSRNKKIKRMK